MRDFFEIGLDRKLGGFKRVDGPALNLGAGNKPIKGALPLDLPEWDADHDHIPYNRNSISTVYAYHILEHVERPIDLLYDIQRVLKPGGIVNIVVPYYSAQIQASDLDHKSVFTEKTWRVLFDNQYYGKNARGWEFKVNLNCIFGLVERNICLFTQLEKEL